MKKNPSILYSVSASIIATTVALLIVEIFIRVYVSRPQQSWSDRPRFYFNSPKNISMQDYGYEVPKPQNRYRIAAIGDSFTFAPYMQFTDTYVKKLEQMLNLQDGGRTTEVINYGVPAYSTSHEIPVTKKAIREGADLILLQITLNDPEIKHHTPSGLKEHMPDRFGALSLSGKLGSIAKRWKTLGFILTRFHNTETHRAYADYFLYLFNNPRTWTPFKRSMSNLVETARKANIPVRAVVFPLFGLPMDETYPFFSIHEKVAELMGELNVPSLDLSPIYKDIPLARLQVIPGVDRHPNEIAHRMAAEEIYLWLEDMHILPPESLIQGKFATRLGIDAQRQWKPSPDNS